MKHIITYCLTALALTACSSDLTDPATQDNGLPISFTVTTENSSTRSNLQSVPLSGYNKQLWLVPVVTDATTRGTQLTSESVLTSFGISAFQHPQAQDISTYTPGFFYNLEAVRNGETGKYVVSQDYYWPADNERLTFYAYAPYGDSNVVLSDDDVAGPQTISYTVAPTVTDQADLLTATALNQTPTTSGTPTVSLQFHHALTGVRFVVGDQFLEGWIKSITIKNVYGRGTKTIGGDWVPSGDKTTFSVSYNTDRPVTGASGQAVTDDDETFLMIPQTLGETGQEVEIVYQDNAHNDYTVKAPLTGTWQAGTTVTYAISSTDLTTLRVSTIDFPIISGAPKTAWANGDQVGMYVVGDDGTTLIHRNIPVTYNDGAWTISHPTTANIYDLPGQTYFFYYPYSDASSGQPVGYPEAASSADETADDFFTNVVAQHTIATDQSDYNDFIASDLCIAKATHDTPASTIKATLSRKVGLAFISLGTDQANKTKVFTNNNSGTVTETGNVTASHTFSGNTPYNNSTNYCAFVKAATATSFSSVTTEKDSWEAALVFTIAAGESETQTAHSQRKNWEYVNAIWEYTTPAAHTFTIPVNGNYTMECWGASGGSGWYINTSDYGRGAYTSGTINLTTSTNEGHLYVYVGGKGTSGVQTDVSSKHKFISGGFNGGGRGMVDDNPNDVAGGGGGATDIRLLSGATEWSSRIMVAAGGGGGHKINEDAEKTYDIADWTGGLHGGAPNVTGKLRAWSDQGATANIWTPVVNQTAGNAPGQGVNAPDATTHLNHGMAGGGGGYYGGVGFIYTPETMAGRSSGGSSFISGATGCATVTGYTFSSTSFVSGTNSSCPSTTIGGTARARTKEDGYARITLTRW